MVGREAFIQNQRLNVAYPNKENDFMTPNHENKGDYYVNPCNGGKRIISYKPKHQHHLSQREE